MSVILEKIEVEENIPEYDRASIPTKPRIEKALRGARKFIKESGIRWLPVNPYEIYELYNWGLYSVTEAEDILMIEDPLQIREKCCDAKTIMCRDSGDYITVYNDEYLPDRIRWTLTHEIGHIVCGHLTDFTETIMARGSLTNEKYRVLEREANIFAAEVLAPMAVLKTVWALSHDDIASLCSISKEAAIYRESDLRQYWNHKAYCEADDALKAQFHDFLTLVGSYKKIINLPTVSNMINNSGNNNQGKKKKLFIKTGPDNKFLECPRCGNSNISPGASYCKICGLYLFNTCGGPPNMKHETHGPVNNPGDARYCEICGQETLLYRQGFLLPWEEILKKHGSITSALLLDQKRRSFMSNFKFIQEDWEESNLSAFARKSSKSKRWETESPDQFRTEYQRDVGRIIYCDAFRRLRMKTQVFTSSGLDQHNRTRLTHSIEVSQIAKSIARPLCLNMDLTEAIALGHDLGHTPFGHAGEEALQTILGGKDKFSHNAQGVWVVQKNLCGRVNKDGREIPGLNLTYDVSEGIWKHTTPLNVNEFNELQYLRPSKPSSLEGQVVNIADGIAYIKHDIDDGMRAKLINLSDLKNVWIKNTDIPFDRNTWHQHFIIDVITYCIDSDSITFSPQIHELYRAIKKLIKEKILLSDLVLKNDKEGKEIIFAIYDYSIKNIDWIIKKHPRQNHFVFENFGPEKVVVNYIQWLGDETARAVFRRIKHKS